MPLRMPRRLQNGFDLETGASVLDVEVLAEKAASLGRAGQRVERTLHDLTEADPSDPAHGDLLRQAADAVYGYFVQRELLGFVRHDDAIAQYGIPGAVLARLGSR